jgi:hypothetical protein
MHPCLLRYCTIMTAATATPGPWLVMIFALPIGRPRATPGSTFTMYALPESQMRMV